MSNPPPAFTCPVCGAESWNPSDAAHGYCGRCHDYTGVDTRLDAQIEEVMRRVKAGEPVGDAILAVVEEDEARTAAEWKTAKALLDSVGGFHIPTTDEAP